MFNKKFLPSIFATMFAASGFISMNSSAFADDVDSKYSAKALFFGEDEVVAVSTSTDDKTKNNSNVAKNATKKKLKVASTKNSSIGASYYIRLLDKNGNGKNVLASRNFKAGERFKLGVKINRPSYIYVYNEDPNGQKTLLYPQPNQNNFVDVMGTVYLPEKGAFEFDNEPGTEKLLVYISDTKQDEKVAMQQISTKKPDIITASAADVMCNNSNSNSSEYASKAIGFTEDVATNCDNSAGNKYSSKSISFTDDTTSAEPASYVVKNIATPDDAKLLLNINLKHN